MAAPQVVGRETELASIETFLAEVLDGPVGLALWGQAGIGKTVLWQEGVEQARARAATVLTHRAVEACPPSLHRNGAVRKGTLPEAWLKHPERDREPADPVTAISEGHFVVLPRVASVAAFWSSV
jgi:Cdc6-like AAA superfamily ATPase